MSNLFAVTLDSGTLATLWGAFFGTLAVIWAVWGLIKRWLEGKGIIETPSSQIDKMQKSIDSLVEAALANKDASEKKDAAIKKALKEIKDIIDHHDALHRPKEMGTPPKAWCRFAELSAKMDANSDTSKSNNAELRAMMQDLQQLILKIAILIDQETKTH